MTRKFGTCGPPPEEVAGVLLDPLDDLLRPLRLGHHVRGEQGQGPRVEHHVGGLPEPLERRGQDLGQTRFQIRAREPSSYCKTVSRFFLGWVEADVCKHILVLILQHFQNLQDLRTFAPLSLEFSQKSLVLAEMFTDFCRISDRVSDFFIQKN